MFRINWWKVGLIFVILVFAVIYILPTPSSTYGSLYGYLEFWMQKEIPQPTVTDDAQLKFSLSAAKLPAGIEFHEAVEKIERILTSRLAALGVPEDDISFQVTEDKEVLLKIAGKDTKADLESLIPKMQLYGSIPLSLRPLLPDKRLNLGLDLRGGVYLVLELDMDESIKALLEERSLQMREQLRSDRILASSIEVDQKRRAMIVTVKVKPTMSEDEKREYLKRAEKILDEQNFFGSPDKGAETQDEVKYTITMTQDGVKQYTEEAIERVFDVLQNRIDAFGVAEPSIRKVPNQPRIIVQLPGARDSSQALNVVKRMGRLEFKLVAEKDGSPWIGSANTAPPTTVPDDMEVRYDPEGKWYVLKKEVLLTGERIRSAGVAQRGFGYVVTLAFDSPGRRKFSKVTGDNVGKLLAILLDGKVQSAPQISERISGGAEIRGSFTAEDATDLAKILRAGAFPVGVRVGEERTVGPTLGRTAIENGVKAAAVGLALVILFMIIYYKVSGVIAIIALIVNIVLMVAALAGFGATLTLPGLAGLVLTVGMAVDANVLIFERVREELRSGKTVRSAVDSGYRRTIWTILDANITTLLTALVLYQFGTGPVKGFAVTLSLGIVASVFTALVVTREMYNIIYSGRTVKKLSI